MGTHPIFESDFDCLTDMALVQNLGQVSHGRRAGTPVNKDVFVIGEDEFERIKMSLNKRERDMQKINKRKQEINEAQAKSKATVSTWTNTIEGQRKAKLAAKAKREEEEEKARLQLDLEEEIFQANERRKIIEAAKKLQFEENDRAKNFHSALGFVEVLKEREMQIAAKKEQQKRMKNISK